MKTSMLAQSVYLLMMPLFMLFAALACGGLVERMQILDAPVYVCPTATPRPTDEVGDGTPQPTPYPTPTPYVIRPPDAFYRGDAVFAGGFNTSLRLRLRLVSVQTLAALPAPDSTAQSLQVWRVEIKNVGGLGYEVFPAAQMVVSAISAGGVTVEGVWGASSSAAVEAGLTSPYEAVLLPPGVTQVFDLAAYTPAGQAKRLTFLLDPTQRSLATAIPGGNPLVWTTAANPHCRGDIRDPGAGGVLPTPLAS